MSLSLSPYGESKPANDRHNQDYSKKLLSSPSVVFLRSLDDLIAKLNFYYHKQFYDKYNYSHQRSIFIKDLKFFQYFLFFDKQKSRPQSLVLQFLKFHFSLKLFSTLLTQLPLHLYRNTQEHVMHKFHQHCFLLLKLACLLRS